MPTKPISSQSVWRGHPIFFLVLFLQGHLLSGCSILHSKNELSKPSIPVLGQVVLQWKGDPSETFNVYRRSENGNNIKINNEPVKPLNAFSGGKQLTQFEYTDRTVIVGEEYYYNLETIDKDGKTSMWESPWKMTATALPDSLQPK